MSARIAVLDAAQRNGWNIDVDVDPVLSLNISRNVLLLTRGTDAVAVEFTATGAVRFAGLYPADRVQVSALDGSIRGYARQHVDTRSRGKRDLVLSWLSAPVAAPTAPSYDETDTAVVVRGDDDIHGDGTTCRDCGDPADPATIENRPTCPDCLKQGYWKDLFAIVHLHGSDTERGAAAMAELRAAGQWCDYDETCTCEACRDINFPNGVPATVRENTDSDPADTGAGTDETAPAPYVAGDPDALAHDPIVTGDARVIRPGAVHVWARGGSNDPVRIGTYTIDAPDVVASVARDIGTTDGHVYIAMGRALDKQSPSVWPVDHDTAVVVHPGRVTAETLNSVMELDTVVHVTVDGRVIVRHDIHAPDVYDSELPDSSEWTLMTGYSGQHGSTGANLHSSEFVGGGLARDILATPGLYVACVDTVTSCDMCDPDDGDGCDDDHIAGWVVATIPDDTDPADE